MINLNPKIIFLHIPKTGGTTLSNAFEQISSLNNIQHLRGGSTGIVPKFSYNYFEIKSKNYICDGHFVFEDTCKDADLFTLVRDINKTFVSSIYFHFFSTYKQKKLNLKIMDRINEKISLNFNLSLKDIPTINALFENNFFTSNIFTKTIAGIPYEKYFYVENDYKINESDYNLALNNLKFFKLIGNIDYFDHFLQKFISLYNFRLISYTKKNIANYDRNFINKIITKLSSKIFEYNKFDYLLMNAINKTSFLL